MDPNAARRGAVALASALRSAREKLCIAQTNVEAPAHRRELQTALDIVDRVGVFNVPEWSKYNDPTTEFDS